MRRGGEGGKGRGEKGRAGEGWERAGEGREGQGRGPPQEEALTAVVPRCDHIYYSLIRAVGNVPREQVKSSGKCTEWGDEAAQGKGTRSEVRNKGDAPAKKYGNQLLEAGARHQLTGGTRGHGGHRNTRVPPGSDPAPFLTISVLGARGDGDQRLCPLHGEGSAGLPSTTHTRAGRELLVTVRVHSDQHVPVTRYGARPSRTESKDGAHRDRKEAPPAQPRSRGECRGSTGPGRVRWGSVLSCVTGNQQGGQTCLPDIAASSTATPTGAAREERRPAQTLNQTAISTQDGGQPRLWCQDPWKSGAGTLHG